MVLIFNTENRTMLMVELEIRFQMPMEQLLTIGTGRDIAAKLGVSEYTISEWRKRLGLKTRRGNKGGVIKNEA